MHKHGDTLIEVALAIGIFSLVAIAVVSVVSGSTSSAQSALEVTLAREEIDAQAEAIRFIQTSYIAGGTANVQGNDKYKTLWNKITSRAVEKADVLSYNPSTCSELYAPNYLNNRRAFIINTRNLGLDYDPKDTGFAENIIITPSKDDNGVFTPAVTYPRMVYGGNSDALLSDDITNTELTSAEGIFVIAVKDQGSTTIVTENGASNASAYYDFYIRTCWFNPGASKPSTISTVIRLQDPEAIQFVQTAEVREVELVLDGNGNNGKNKNNPAKITGKVGDKINLSSYKDYYDWNFGSDETLCGDSNVRFVGWSHNKFAKEPQYGPDDGYRLDGRSTQTLYAVWETECPCCFWFDVNVFLDSDEINEETNKPKDTSGRNDYPIEVYVNDYLIKSQDDVSWNIPDDLVGSNRRQYNLKDWYSKVPLGARIKINLQGKDGTCIKNIDSPYQGNIPLCSGNCSVTKIDDSKYSVELTILPEFINPVLDSSQHNSIQLEPVWGDC